MIKDTIKSYKHVIWDFNGTLLDDVDIAVATMNSLLCRRELPLISINKYKEILSFPIIEYYENLGFDFSEESFENLANEFILELSTRKNRYKLHNGTVEVLNYISNLNIDQSILSAANEQELIKDVKRLSIYDYFENVIGLSDNYALSKVEKGRFLIMQLGLKPDEALLIGDTVHDYEVAKEIGCDCLLICNGHQSYNILSKCNVTITDSVFKVIDFIKGAIIA